ncbi:protoporphyrinogen oxidase HemJ [Candidatus Paracaedibacter symbiosus]|uniref:protoporphyrinogen oxidase HemJ n=1 Tax=Candidatus Paracaedibacter symbiosus TaxID=244582 RepID=UPI000509DCE9|nr:protoporphyrinogen oxidase HemJ [Candidatus Paracaedibacter symbiosus]
MNDFFLNYLLELKAFHVICIIAWMAGLFYFPRLLVYHVQHQNNPEIVAVFKVMESRLYKIIMLPAMIFSLLSGGILATVMRSTWSSGWMHLKLLAVICLVIFQLLLDHWRQSLATNNYHHSEKFFRLINEIPTLLLIIIVVSVILKPF